MLSTIRRIAGLVFLVSITLLFLDFTGTVHAWVGWMAKIQFLPAVLALNVGIVIALVAVTIVFGRVYCSVICPLGVMQDVIARAGKRNRYRYSKEKRVLRIAMLVAMIALLLIGMSWIAALIAPYSSYGRMVQTLLGPVWIWINNLLADMSRHAGNYMFYHVDYRLKGAAVIAIAVITFVVIAVLAFRNGRTYCNTICPVGTVLGYLARYSLFAPVIDTPKGNSCGLCGRNCKASCIDSRNHTIDYSRCVACMDCIDKCHQRAISYTRRGKVTDHSTETTATSTGVNAAGRRDFMGVCALTIGAAAAKAAEKTVDGGLAAITDKQIPERDIHIVPPGALSIANLARHCTACQLCVTVCPNEVLRPSTDLSRLMQPEASYERGYCRPECNKCGSVCPTGAIHPVSLADKSSTQIGHAVWLSRNCIVYTDGVSCGNCARHCPTGAITMVPSISGDDSSPKIPAVNRERCIGCGACENLCPARPYSAIYVEGHLQHRTV